MSSDDARTLQLLPESFVLAYERASSDPKERKLSVERQARINDEIAALNFPGVPVLHFCDNDLSASKPGVYRPEYHRMLNALRAGGAVGVVAVEQSRLTRQPTEWEDFMVVATRSDLAVVHTKSGERPIAEGNRIQGRIMSILDADEAERTRIRLLRYHADAAKLGKPVSVAYGYTAGRDEHGEPTRPINHEQAAVILRIADLVEKGHGITTIARQLTEEGVPSPSGRSIWHPKRIRDVITTPTVTGLRIYNDVAYEGQWKPIIERKRWEKLCRMLTVDDYVFALPNGGVVTRRRTPHPDTVREYLLSGSLLVCGRCLCPMRAGLAKRTASGEQRRTYVCARRPTHPQACQRMATVAEPLEVWVLGYVKDMLANPQFLARLSSAGKPNEERDALMRELGELNEREAIMSTEFASGRSSATAYQAGLQVIEAQRTKMRTRLDALAPEYIDFGEHTKLHDQWEALPIKRRREIVHFLIGSRPIVCQPAKKVGRVPFDPTRFEVNWLF